MSAQKRKQQSFSVQLKKKIIDEKEAHPTKSYADLAKQFSDKDTTLTKSNVQRILGDKQKILDAIDAGAGAKRKRLRTAKDTDLEAAVLAWFQQVRTQNVAVSGPLLKVTFDLISNLTLFQQKAIELAEELGIEDFKASDHWLENFKERHGIKFRTEQGEAAAVNQEVVQDWKQTVLRQALEKYSADDVFNADETGLFWRLMPNKTLAFKGKTLRISGFIFGF